LKRQLIDKKDREFILLTLLERFRSNIHSSPLTSDEIFELTQQLMQCPNVCMDGWSHFVKTIAIGAIRRCDEELLRFCTDKLGAKVGECVEDRRKIVFGIFKFVQKNGLSSKSTISFNNTMYKAMTIDPTLEEDIELMNQNLIASMTLPHVRRGSRFSFIRVRAMNHACAVAQFLRQHDFPIHKLKYFAKIVDWVAQHFSLPQDNEFAELTQETVIFLIGCGAEVHQKYSGTEKWKIRGLNDWNMYISLKQNHFNFLSGKFSADLQELIFDFAYCHLQHCLIR